MAAVWQASGTLLGVTSGDITPVIPTHQAGDILICLTSNRDTGDTCSTPSGWTLGTGSPVAPAGAWITYWFWKRATSGSETNPLCNWASAIDEAYAQVHTIRGAIASGDFFSASAFSADNTDTITVTGLTTTVDNQNVAVAAIGSDNASASVTVASTDPASYTQRHFSTITTGADATGEFHEAVRATAGATGSVTLNHDSTMPSMAAVVLALKNAVGGFISTIIVGA